MSTKGVVSANSVLKLQIYCFLFLTQNINFISEIIVAYRKIIAHAGCNWLLYFLTYKLGRSICNTISLSIFNVYFKYYIKNFYIGCYLHQEC